MDVCVGSHEEAQPTKSPLPLTNTQTTPQQHSGGYDPVFLYLLDLIDALRSYAVYGQAFSLVTVEFYYRFLYALMVRVWRANKARSLLHLWFRSPLPRHKPQTQTTSSLRPKINNNARHTNSIIDQDAFTVKCPNSYNFRCWASWVLWR